MHDTSESQETVEFIPLPKHVYPRWVRWFGIITLVAFCTTLVNFVCNELPLHREIHKTMLAADNAFGAGDYITAARLYGEILETYPTCKEMKIKQAKSLFARCSHVFQTEPETWKAGPYFSLGMMVLAEDKYTRSEREALQRMLPVCYRDDFEAAFVVG